MSLSTEVLKVYSQIPYNKGHSQNVPFFFNCSFPLNKSPQRNEAESPPFFFFFNQMRAIIVCISCRQQVISTKWATIKQVKATIFL